MEHPVDIHVGQRVRQRRCLLEMTQQQLAEKVGIKFQQIQKHGNGANRLSSSWLWGISEVMYVPMSLSLKALGRLIKAKPRRKVF